MALSLDSKIKDILRSPEGKAVMEKYAPGSTSNPSMKLVGAMTYRKLLSYPESAELSAVSGTSDKCTVMVTFFTSSYPSGRLTLTGTSV